MELERITTDMESEEALTYLRKTIYVKVATSQKGKLKSHLDGSSDSVESFKKSNL